MSIIRTLLCTLWTAAAAASLEASVLRPDTTLLPDSIVPVNPAAAGSAPRITRSTLTAEELAAPMEIVAGLRMRRFAELESRVQAGQTVPRAEMESTYLPLPEDYQRVAAWLGTQGLALTLKDNNHTNLFVRGSVSAVARALGVTFARVSYGGGEFTSAVTAPSLPADFAPLVLGVDGLQPHFRMRPPTEKPDAVTNDQGRTVPSDVAAAYNVPADLDGSGQTIAIIMDQFPLPADLTAFWLAADITDDVSKVSTVNVGAGPTASTDPDAGDEVTLDVEWASGLAPGAHVRVYGLPGLFQHYYIQACTQIMNEGLASVVSYSASGVESQYPASLLTMESQTLAQLNAAGISVLNSSGDGGSNPTTGTGNGYDPTSPQVVEYPASDPNVTGVGGTTVTFNANWIATSETTWSSIGQSATPAATGGGSSGFFARPAWQVGQGVPAGGMRCVPDIAVAASFVSPSGYHGGLVVVNGQVTSFLGTSLSCPSWAAFTALLKQHRATQGLTKIGLLNRALYPLIGGSAFNDVTGGSNGAFAATTGYDLCTGVGSPDLTNLITETEAEIFYVGPPAAPVAAGTSVTMNVTSPLVSTYQWLLDGVAIPGATAAVYTIPVAGAADDGTYRVQITNSLGTNLYQPGVLTTTSDARISNLSARATVQPGANILIAGFVVAGTGAKSMLVRGVGPALGPFGVPGFLAAPKLDLYGAASALLASNTAWGGGAALTSTMAGLGAFALPATSLDTALLQSVAVGGYTAQISGVADSSGVALAELYDADGGGSSSRVINISARADVQTGSNILIAGFVVAPGPSHSDETVMIRAVGPTLASFGVGGALTSPVLTLLDSTGEVVATNQGWNNPSVRGASAAPAGVEIATAASMAKVGAFGLGAGSADSAMTVTLPPGLYTAQVSGAGASTGVGLVEVYEVR